MGESPVHLEVAGDGSKALGKLGKVKIKICRIELDPQEEEIRFLVPVLIGKKDVAVVLMVMSWTWLYLSSLDMPWKRRPMKSSFISSRGFSVAGSGGIMLRIGFTKRHIACMALPNSS